MFCRLRIRLTLSDGEWLGRVLHGFYQHHAAPRNQVSLRRFRERACRYWRHVSERRSQRGRLRAERVARLVENGGFRIPGSCTITRAYA